MEVSRQLSSPWRREKIPTLSRSVHGSLQRKWKFHPLNCGLGTRELQIGSRICKWIRRSLRVKAKLVAGDGEGCVRPSVRPSHDLLAAALWVNVL